jgi:hypothetical protein
VTDETIFTERIKNHPIKTSTILAPELDFGFLSIEVVLLFACGDS